MRRKLIVYDQQDVDELDAYLKEWSERRRGHRGMPDYTTDAIYGLPLSVAIIKSSRRLEMLTLVLAAVTLVLVVLTGALILRT